MPPPLLAFDENTIVGMVVAVIWVLVWLVKLVTGQNARDTPAAPRPRPAARPRDEKLQDEIDVFLEEVGGKRKNQGTRPAARPPAPAKAAAGKKPAQRPPANKAAPPLARRVRPGQEISTRHIEDPAKKVGDRVQQHLQRHMAERVTRETATHLPHQVDRSVVEHLGATTAAGPSAAAAAQPAGPADATAVPRGAKLAELFRNPATVRQAMVVSLILSPPPGRKRSVAH
jgi:hypothetical protein